MKFIIQVLLLTMATSLMAQNPNWDVNENAYEFTMTRVAFVTIDDIELSSPNDRVAAFINNELRGVSALSSVSSSNRKYAYMTIFSNDDNQVINYKVYDSSADVVIDIPRTDTFNINQHKGDLYQAYSIASPTLNDQAQFVTIDFPSIEELDVIVNDAEVVIQVDEEEDVTNLNFTFTLSNGATLLKNRQQIISGNTSVDFSSTQEYVVRSADESRVKVWKVTVQKVDNPADGVLATFFKKNAVCHTRGIIKVIFPINGAQAVLKKDLEIVNSSLVENETVVFNDLQPGSYTVEIGSYIKNIVIDFIE